ncbi:ATP-binding protein [Paenibacillus aurantiacus]|uniref:ATP-binding protein n=1 Tax=Paenibacillus aurantiacus TaxID=1936118 RepID=A0ABV5KQW5_9BACL
MAKNFESDLIADLIQVDKAMESWRDSGFDLSTAIGEPVDNSIEASAKLIRIETRGSNNKIDEIIIADDGLGINPGVLAQVLKMGFSTRYNQRKGLGRYGVGMKLAALSQATRVDIYTNPKVNSDRYYHAFLDLSLISVEKQKDIRAVGVSGYPEKYRKLMTYADGREFETGTLIVWSDVDRLENGGKYGNSIQEHLNELTKFLARAYRKFINAGITIELNGKVVELYDPLFLLESDRIKKMFEPDSWQATLMDESEIDIDGHIVNVKVSLYPKAVRLKKGEGGGSRGSAKKFDKLHIEENQGRVSILRNGREIYYNVIPRLFPTRIEHIDRFIGVELSFPAEIDEYFQVRNVKRGAEPVGKLKKRIEEIIDKPIRTARKLIKDTFNETAHNERKAANNHTAATQAVNIVEETSPRGRGDSGIEPEQIVEDLVADLDLDKKHDLYQIKELEKRLEDQTITITDGSWPGKELFEIVHYNGRAVITLNYRHPFMKEIYLPLKQLGDDEPSNLDPEDLIRHARLMEAAIDVLFMAFAKAENMERDPDRAYSDLRSYWGQFSAAYMRELVKHV